MENGLYDIGELKDMPEVLYDMAVKFDQFFGSCELNSSAEIWEVLKKVSFSLWRNLPSVVVIDLRDPDDPTTWGDFGPPSASVADDDLPLGPLF